MNESKSKYLASVVISALVLTASMNTLADSPSDSVSFANKDYCFGQNDNPNGADINISGSLNSINDISSRATNNVVFSVVSKSDNNELINIKKINPIFSQEKVN